MLSSATGSSHEQPPVRWVGRSNEIAVCHADTKHSWHMVHRDLPHVLGYMQSLKTVSIKGNPIRNEKVHSSMAQGIGELKAVCGRFNCVCKIYG